MTEADDDFSRVARIPDNCGNPPNVWRAAVTEACVINGIDWDDNDPAKSLARLIQLEICEALDPAISREAANLIQRGRDEAREELNLSSIHDGRAVGNIKWRYDPPPKRTKIFLLNKGGVAITPGPWPADGSCIAWQLLFDRDKELEESRGLS